MLCQQCGQRQANCHFAITRNGQSGQAHLCAQCAQRGAQQYRQAVAAMFPFAAAAPFTGAPAPAEMRAPSGQTDLPAGPPAQDPEFAGRRELELLRRELRMAVQNEEFERAAGLQGRIRKVEQKCRERKELGEGK